MKIKFRHITVLVISFFFVCDTYAQFNKMELNDKVDSLVNSYRGSTNTAVILGVIRKEENGTAHMLKYKFGHLTRDTNTSPPVNDSTLFQIGSITKTFTTAILSMLLQNGTVTLYDTVQNFLPDSVHAPVYISSNDTTVIRFIDLATHYSGLPDEPDISSGGMTSYQDMYNYLDTVSLPHAPGECYNYSDIGIALLGVSLQHILQDSIELLIPGLVCDTLGMSNSRIVDLSPGQLIRRAQGYQFNGDTARYQMVNWPAYHGAGGLYSTLDDMMKYLRFCMRLSDVGMENVLDSLLKERRVTTNETTCVPIPEDSIGLVWEMNPLFPQNPKNHVRKIDKDGGTNGFNSYITFTIHPVTNLKTGVVMVANWKNPHPLQNVAVDLLKYLNETESVGILNNTQDIDYRLGQNYPNPFNPKTVITYSILRAENVSLKVYDILGNEVATLVNKKQNAGNYNIEWNGESFSSGVYYYKIQAGEFVETRKMTLIK